MPDKILVTAFEPFGIIRGLQGKNASLDVLEALRARAPDRWLTEVLPVADRAEAVLRGVLERMEAHLGV